LWTLSFSSYESATISADNESVHNISEIPWVCSFPHWLSFFNYKAHIKSIVLPLFCRFIFDAMHAITGAYAGPIFVEKLGADPVAY
jgi:phosphoglucomutase